MAIPVEAVRLALNAVADAPPAERRQRMVALFEAAVQLRERVARYHDWLVREDQWLTEHAGRASQDWERETRYLQRVQLYQEACDVLAAALEVVKDAQDGSVGKVKRPVQAVLGEAPF